MRSWLALTSALLLVISLGVQPAQARLAPASASCVEAGVTWRVDFEKFGTEYGPAVQVTGLQRNGADASAQTWELRYERAPGDYPPASPPPVWPASYPPPHVSVRGPLSDVGRVVAEYYSPRLVTPDGACTVYLSPFPGSGRKVAVLGDDLVHQLNSREYNQSRFEGFVEGNAHTIGIRVEVEGHTGARWTGADNLNDEFRGLLEHDLDGAVVALGLNDALYIAAGATQAERDARRDEVYAKLQTVFAEHSSRTGCLVVVTALENASSLDPEYAAAAVQVNNFFRWVIAAGGAEDAVELSDFGAQAKTHTEWFGSDGAHLSVAGTLVYTATLTKAAQRCAENIVLHGKPGTLDKGILAGKTQVGSGHALTTRPVSTWSTEGGKAIAFTGSMLGPGGQDPASQGLYPVFGILTKGANGAWRVAEGQGWRNSWSSRELVDATIAADPVNGPARANAVCPDGDGAGPQPPHCYWFNELAILPRSGDVAIAQYSNKTAVLKLDGPDASGRYSLRIAGVHTLGEIDDPSWTDPQYKIGVAWREVQADPTSALGDERFALQPDMSAHRYASDGTIAGRTIWVVWGGYGIKVFPKGKVSTAPCFEPGKALESYVASPAGARAAWGKICPAAYNVKQAGAIGPVFNFLEDEATHNIVIGSWPAGNAIVVDPEGTGTSMTFRVGQPAALHAQGVTSQQVEAPCPMPDDQTLRCPYPPALQAMVGPIDASGRLWTTVEQEKPLRAPQHPEHQSRHYDQWMFSLDLSRLMGREPVRLAAQTVIHAEQTVTKSTRQVTGSPAVKDVVSDAELRPCAFPVACTDPVSGLSGGWALGHETTGISETGFAEYRIAVPKAGTYRLTYRAADRAVTGPAKIRLSVDGGAPQDTTVTGAAMADVAGPALTLAQGTHTLRVSAPSGAHGWQLDWIRFTR